MTQLLLTGPAGSGKTHRVLEEFQHSLVQSPPLQDDLFLILPSAEHRERVIQLLLQRGLSGFFHRRVTTLQRLISQTLGVGEEGVISNTARSLLLKTILTEKEWEYFSEVQRTPGFLNLMLSFILELKESLISAPFFRSRMNELKQIEPDFAPKYEALAGIYESYQSALGQRGLKDPQDHFAILQQRKPGKISKRRGIKKIWLDGFFDFSNLQLAYLEELCERSEEVTMALTYDPDERRAGLFEAIRPTYEALVKMGFKAEFLPSPCPSPLGRGKKGEGDLPETLARLQRNIFNPAVKKMKPSDSLMIFEAVGIEGEVEMIARQIESLHQEGDYRFSDFAILLRQIGGYEGVIRSVFSRYSIPVEIHEREKLGFSPLVQVVVRLLKIFRDGWKRGDLMEFLKSSYVRRLGGEPKDYEWVSRLERGAMEQGVFKGREAWLAQPPSLRPSPLGRGNKGEGLKILAELEDGLTQAKEFSRFKALLLEAVEKSFGIFERKDSLEEYVRRDAASFRRLLSILDEIEFSFHSAPSGGAASQGISFEQFADRFFRLAELDLFSLHEKDKNKVQVYDISLARQKEYRIVFIAGLLEKKFPVQIKEDPILSDWERRLFNAAFASDYFCHSRESGNPKPGFPIKSFGNDKKTRITGKQGILSERLPRQPLERYLFYVALTRARERVFLSYPRLDLEGKEYLPSYYVQEVKTLFDPQPETRQQDLSRPYPCFAEAVSERELEMGIMGRLWTLSKEKISEEPLLFYFMKKLSRRPANLNRFRRAFYEISDEFTDPRIKAAEIFHPKVTSATTLEEYAKCAFRYYSRRVLQLQDQEEDPNVFTRGTILHEVLERCFSRWASQPDFYKNREKARELALAELEEALKRNPLLSEKKYRYDLECEDLRQSLERFLDHELERLQKSPLQPRYFEFNFGGEGSEYPPLELEGSPKIIIRGKIDRIDVDREHRAGLVLDYKRTALFKKGDLESGIALQLPIYSMALKQILKLEPIGAELYSIKERKSNGFYSAGSGFFPGGRRMVLKKEEFEALLERSTGFIRKFFKNMQAAQIPVKPRYCDPYCSYGSVCRIQKWKLPLIQEEIKEEDRKLKSLPLVSSATRHGGQEGG